MSLPTCPKCGCQLEVKLSYASGPKSSAPSGDIGELLTAAEDRSMNAWEMDFITKLRERYNQYGERVMLSEKQRAILEKIARGE